MELGVLAAAPTPFFRWIRVATVADFAWVATTAAVLLSPWAAALSERGVWTLVVIAQFVLLWGVLQALGVRFARSVTTERAS